MRSRAFCTAGFCTLTAEAACSAVRLTTVGATYMIRLDSTVWSTSVDGAAVEVVPGEPDHPDVAIDTDPKTLVDLLGNRRALPAAIRRDAVRVHRDRTAFEWLLDAMVFPTRVALAAG